MCALHALDAWISGVSRYVNTRSRAYMHLQRWVCSAYGTSCAWHAGGVACAEAETPLAMGTFTMLAVANIGALFPQINVVLAFAPSHSVFVAWLYPRWITGRHFATVRAHFSCWCACSLKASPAFQPLLWLRPAVSAVVHMTARALEIVWSDSPRAMMPHCVGVPIGLESQRRRLSLLVILG